ncbi:UNVERIFIED_CONTAM: hypothetical protein PYX00_011561 [Menopon gallinae]|uniref:CTLH domain-containing protein n=1 Tax=Menopon gallinae TaxID=328185 RepID=A0AAW2H7Y9_9NEOP
MDMVGAALLLGLIAMMAGRVEDAAEHKNQVEANSGSEQPGKPREHDSGDTAATSTDSGEAKSAGTPYSAGVVKRTAARIDPNAVLKVEIRISKSKRGGGDSSVSRQNGVRAGGRAPEKKQVVGATPPEQSRPASTVQTATVALQRTAASGDQGRLENFEGGLSVLCIVSRNMNLIKEKIHRTDSAGRVRGVLALRSEDGDVRDYWGRLRFKETGGVYVDETGFYEGRVVGSPSEVLESGRLTKNGFYQPRDLSDKEVEEDFQTTKLLLSAIARERGTSVDQMASENCDLPLVDKLLFTRIKDDFEVDMICERIIHDHLLFTCCLRTFRRYKLCATDTESDIRDLELRKEIRDLIAAKNSTKALDLIDDPNLKKILLKQSFIELVSQSKLKEALDVAEKYLNIFEDDDVFSVLGYKNLNDEEIRHYFSKESVEKFQDVVNETLFCQRKGRGASLLAIAWFHYKSIQSFLNK